MEDIGLRLKQILDTKNLSPSEFAEQVGIQRSSLSHIFSGRNKPSIDLLLKVKKQFPEIDLEWLITGIGLETNTLSTSKVHLEGDTAQKSNVTNVNKDAYSDENQENKSLQGADTIDTPKQEQIERIIIFYTDGQFKEYKNK